MLGFIHITKSGGTNIKDKNKNDNIIYYSYHDEDALFYKTNQMKCFAILREPIDRYVSLFYYNMKGSEKYEKKDDYYTDINIFVNDHYNDRNLINKYENGGQFKKQIEWLQDADMTDTFIVKFDKQNLINNIRNLCDFNGIKFIYDDNDTNNINITNYIDIVELTEDSKQKIKKMYIEDVVLYDNLNCLNKSFCRLGEIYIKKRAIKYGTIKEAIKEAIKDDLNRETNKSD